MSGDPERLLREHDETERIAARIVLSLRDRFTGESVRLRALALDIASRRRRPQTNRRRRRPFLCRLGLHRWGAWDIAPHDFRTIVQACRRCGAGRRMVYKAAALSAWEIQSDAPSPRP